jgi:purine-binding chemotaxis protein CheW
MQNQAYILFELAGAHYALHSTEVQHIEMLEHVTPVPNAPTAVEGVVFSRGQVIPALNLRVRFGFPKAEKTLRTRLIVVQVKRRTVALVVDAAREFENIPIDSIRPIEETLTSVHDNYLQGVATVKERLVMLLNLEAVLNLAEWPAGIPTEVSQAHSTTFVTGPESRRILQLASGAKETEGDSSSHAPYPISR